MRHILVGLALALCIALRFTLAEPAFARPFEAWQCSSKYSAQVLTTTSPVQSPDVLCRRLPLAGAAYNIVPEVLLPSHATAPKEEPPPQSKQIPLRSTLGFLEKLDATANARILGASRKCLLQGRLYAPKNRLCRLMIYRGGASRDSLLLMGKGAGGSAWRLELPGACRNPEVRVKAAAE